MGCTPDNGGIPLGRGSRLHDPRPGLHLWHHRHTSVARHGHPGQAHCTILTLAEGLCRAVDRINPPRVLEPRYCFGRGTSASDSEILCRLLQLRQNASVFAQGCPDFSSDSSGRNHSFTPDPRRASPSLRPGLSFRYTQVSIFMISGVCFGTTSRARERVSFTGVPRSFRLTRPHRTYCIDK